MKFALESVVPARDTPSGPLTLGHVEPRFKTRNHESVYKKGQRAAHAGVVRMAPYGLDSRESREFRAVWLAGFDSTGAK